MRNYLNINKFHSDVIAVLVNVHHHNLAASHCLLDFSHIFDLSNRYTNIYWERELKPCPCTGLHTFIYISSPTEVRTRNLKTIPFILARIQKIFKLMKWTQHCFQLHTAHLVSALACLKHLITERKKVLYNSHCKN